MSDAAAQAQKLVAASGVLGMPMLQHREEILSFVAWYLECFGRPRRILEIGSGHGGSTALWCEMAQGPGAQVVAVDIPMGVHPGGLSPQDAMLRDARLKARYPAFHAVTADSQRPETYSLVVEVMGGPFDLLFIDGDHHYESVKRDFETYSPLVREGYPVLFHDIMDTSYYRALGINVARLWSELPGEKVEWVSRPGGDSGGLGAVIVRAGKRPAEPRGAVEPETLTWDGKSPSAAKRPPSPAGIPVWHRGRAASGEQPAKESEC